MLKSDSNQGGPDWSYQAICEAFDVSQPTITEVRWAYVEGGVKAAIHREKPDRVYERRLDGESEAHLVALAYDHLQAMSAGPRAYSKIG